MAAGNTALKIKRSLTTGVPSSLAAGELAYSYASNTIFIGTSSGTAVLNVGGQYYTSQIDSASSSNNPNTIVKRDASGNSYFGNVIVSGLITGTISGIAQSANTLYYAQNFGIAGGDITASNVSFNGSANVTLNATLNNISGLTAGTYGGLTTVPIVTVAANGRIMSIANSSTISTNLNIAGDTGSNTVHLATETLNFTGGTGIKTAVTGDTVTTSVDYTKVISANTTGATQVISTDLSIPTNNVSIGGLLTVANLNVSGNVIQYNATSTLNVGDPIIYLAANNAGDAVDMGFVGHLVGVGHTGGVSKYQHTGFVRDYNDNKWKLFSNVSAEPTTTVDFTTDAWYDTIKVGGVDVSSGNVANVNVLTANSLTLTNALGISSGGTGASTFNNGQLVSYNGSALVSIANVSTTVTGALSTSNTITSLTTDAYGRVTAYTGAAISGLTVPQGGTGAASFSAGQIVIGNGTGALSSLANVSTSVSGSLGTNNTITSVTTDAYGRLTAYTGAAISGLTVGQGGTGASTFSTGGLLIGNGTGAISTLANSTYTLTGSLAASSTITSLTVDAYGRLTAATASSISGLAVSQGGTGASTFTTNGITYGNGTGAIQVTAAAGTSDQTYSNQILTVTNSGVPVWASAIDGGQF